jgi:hypothetical protein
MTRGPDRAQERRERIKQRIRALRAYTLTEQLALDEVTAGKLFPLLAKYDDEFDKLLASRADIQRRLGAVADLKDPKAIDKLIDDAVSNQRALWDTEEKRLAQLRKILTPAQTARVLVVLPAMERKIQNQLRRVVQPGPGPQGKPVDPFDDDQADLPRPRRRERQLAPRAVPASRTPGCDPFSDLHSCQ